MNSKKNIMIIVGIAVVAFLITFLGINMTKNIGKSESVISTENATDRVAKLLKKVNVSEAEPVKSPVEIGRASCRERVSSPV